MEKTLGNEVAADAVETSASDSGLVRELEGLDANREYKSDLFALLMQNKAYALETYNAVNGSNYDNPEDIQIVTLDHGVSLTIRNDASFILDLSTNYYEHQSTYCPNMPLRNLIYIVEDIEREIDRQKKRRDLFSTRKVWIPTPHFVVFYNGLREKQPDVETQKLSDSFYKPVEEPELELTCKVININPGHNTEIMKKSTVLSGYTELVEMIRKMQNEGVPLKSAIHSAIDDCIRRGILADFLKENRSEVEKSMNLDFTYTRQMESEHEAGREEGREEGIIIVVADLIKAKTISVEEASKKYGVSEESIRKALEEHVE